MSESGPWGGGGGLLESNFVDLGPWLHGDHLGGGGALVFLSVSLGGYWAGGSRWSWAFESGGVSIILRRHLSSRCVKLHIQMTSNMTDREILECPLLLSDLESHLLETENNLMLSGCRKNCVDLKLEHVRIKR